MSGLAAAAPRRPKCVVLNLKRMDFDGRLDLSALRAAADVEAFDASPSDALILERVAGAEVVITKEMVLGGDVVARFPASAVATLVMTHVLAFSASIYEQRRRLQAGDRRHFEDMDANIGTMPHFELAGKTLGLVGGNGAIGTRVGQLALAFGMRVLVSTRSGRCPAGCEVASLPALLEASDFVSVHCPLSDDTRGLLGAEAFARMKPSAYLINTARGAVLDEAALVAALRDGAIAGAALDVQDPEPPALDSPLWDLDNAILTPHVGWRRLETRQRLLASVVADVEAHVAGSDLNVVAPP
ncbi:hydroxypyruvate reductase [Aureococcus anophagefferens]|nr:hydroxypyruvate reductase [Aureococcus anophagefferens]